MIKVWVARRGELSFEGCDLSLEAGTNLFTGEDNFYETFGIVTSLESDLLLIAAAIFATDRACKRGEREDYQRRIEISIPVVNLANLLPLQRQFESALRILSNDAWRITFRQTTGIPEEVHPSTKTIGQVLLFSGGLDSLAAAVDLSEQNMSLQLVSHITRNKQTSSAQVSLVTALRENGINYPHNQFFVSSNSKMVQNPLEHDAEDSQRTRSFLFLVLAALVARRTNHHEIIFLAENGQMAIHLPLTQGRIGAFSTHTAHPNFLAAMKNLLSQALMIPIEISNPYLYKTKAEVIKGIAVRAPHLIEHSQSCWRNSRLSTGVTHCGECIPCFIRRIAVETYMRTDPTKYNKDPWRKDIFKLSSENVGRRNFVDLAEFIVKIEKSSSDEIMTEWPELFSLHMDAPRVIEMYKRFAREARSVLTRYPAVRNLLDDH